MKDFVRMTICGLILFFSMGSITLASANVQRRFFWSFAKLTKNNHTVLMIGDVHDARFAELFGQQAKEFMRFALSLKIEELIKRRVNFRPSVILYEMNPTYFQNTPQKGRIAFATFAEIAKFQKIIGLNEGYQPICFLKPIDERSIVLEYINGIFKGLIYESIEDFNFYRDLRNSLEFNIAANKISFTLGQFYAETDQILARVNEICSQYGEDSIEFSLFQKPRSRIVDNIQKFKEFFKNYSDDVLLDFAFLDYFIENLAGKPDESKAKEAAKIISELHNIYQKGISCPFADIVFLHQILQSNQRKSSAMLTVLIAGEAHVEYILPALQAAGFSKEIGSKSFCDSERRTFYLGGVPSGIENVLQEYYSHND